MAETMGESGANRVSVLRRKMQAGQPAVAEPAPGPQKAVRLAVARAAQQVKGLDLTVAELEESRRSLAEILELLPERAFLAVLEGPGEGLGLMALAPPVLGAVVEVQTTGRLGPGERPARRPTRTDAAMTAGLIDHAMALIEEELDTTPERVWAAGFRYASFLDDPRPLELLLEDVAYRMFRVGVEMGRGQRRGDILLALPAEGRGHPPLRPRADAEGATRAEAGRWAEAMDEAVMGAPAVLTGVLHRMRIPLAMVLALKPGEMVPLPATALERVEVEGLDGRWVGEGRLGQNRGLRAVRLTRLPEGRRGGGPASAASDAEADQGGAREPAKAAAGGGRTSGAAPGPSGTGGSRAPAASSSTGAASPPASAQVGGGDGDGPSAPLPALAGLGGA